MTDIGNYKKAIYNSIHMSHSCFKVDLGNCRNAWRQPQQTLGI